MKPFRILLVCAACVLPPLSAAEQAGVPAEAEIRLGSVAMDIPAEMYRRHRSPSICRSRSNVR